MSESEPQVPPDPILTKSYSRHILVATLCVVAGTVLAIVDEGWWRRPYKSYQAQFKDAYSTYLEAVTGQRRAFVDTVLRGLDEYKELDAKVRELEEETAAERARLDTGLRNVTARGRALAEALKIAKSEIAALTYEAEHAAHEHGVADVAKSEASEDAIEEIERVRARRVEYTWPESGAAGAPEAAKGDAGTVAELLDRALALETRKAELQQALGRLTKPVGEARRTRDEWLARNLGNVAYLLANAGDDDRKAIGAKVAEVGVKRWLDAYVTPLEPQVLEKLKAKVDAMPTDLVRGGEIREIHIPEAKDWVDRCETCHLGTREPLPLTVDGMRDVLRRSGWSEEKLSKTPLALFTSHPRRELLVTHDPERFGCSLCHNGNGVALESAFTAHGLNQHWLFPLHPRANIEAGCVQCHQKDLVLPMGERITAAKTAYLRRGCWGCHRYEGYDRERDLLTALTNRRKAVRGAVDEKLRRAENLFELARGVEVPGDEDEAEKVSKRLSDEAKREQAALQQEVAILRTEDAELGKRLANLHVERQRVGPNLKVLKVKVRPEWIPDWVRNPAAAHPGPDGEPWRPDAKMPTPQWADGEEPKDVAAFVWQSALDPAEFPELRLPVPEFGDAENGRKLLVETGCLACHSIGRGKDRIGGDVAANLSDLGEKDRYEWVVRWVTHPRRRLVPYDPEEKKDVPSSTPKPGLVWTEHTIMPNFRLSEKEARDIASYLVSQRREGAKGYEPAPWLEEKARFERGKKLAMNQGCVSCHEIRGFEDERGIGTELTKEGSKPLERLDFAHLTLGAKRGVDPLADWTSPVDGEKLFAQGEPWYRPRGFFLHKLAKPDLYDTSRYLPDRFLRLRMPQFRLGSREIQDLTSLLLGSVEPQVPEAMRHRPDEAGEAIREGWWIVRKYNCEGCHAIVPGQRPSLHAVPFFAEKIAANQTEKFTPPSLVGTGFRTNPEFLARFLRDPSLGGGREAPASLRPYLTARMPTFDFSEDEIRKLVRFFDALAKQPPVYQRPPVAALAEAELAAAKAIFTDANCANCHVVEGRPLTNETKAPKLDLAAERLRPEWVRRWISAPLELQPGTAMPALFKPSGDGRWLYTKPGLAGTEGYAGDHVDLMVRYLWSLRGNDGDRGR